MKITIVQGAFFPVPPLRGGALEKLWYRLGIEFSRRGHTVTHVSRLCDDLPAESVELGVRHRRVKGYDAPGNRWILKYLDLLYTLRTRKIVQASDIIVTNTFWAPLFLTKRGAVCVCVQRMPKGQMRLYRKVARLHACSQAVADGIAHDDPVAGAKVRVIPNALTFIPDGIPDPAEKAAQILYVGRIHPEKGIELLLQAFARAKERGLCNWTLRLVGPTETRFGGGGEQWALRLRQRFLDKDIAWVGPIFEESALNREFRSAAIFVYPSLAEKGETFGVAPLEAMGWGALPIVSKLDCFRDYIEPGKNGIVFDHRCADPIGALADALIRATTEDREVLSAAALGVRVTHSIEAIAGRFLDDFKAITEDPTRLLGNR